MKFIDSLRNAQELDVCPKCCNLKRTVRIESCVAVLLFFILVNRIWESCHPGLAMGSLMSLQLAFRVKEKSMLTFLFSLSLSLSCRWLHTNRYDFFLKPNVTQLYSVLSAPPWFRTFFLKKTLLVCLCFYEGKCLYGKTIRFD